MAVRGSTQPLSVTFYDQPGGTIVDPAEVSLVITFDGDVVQTLNFPGDLVKESPGHYSYDWEIPLDAELGTYTAGWAAVLPGDVGPSYGYEQVTVTAEPTPEIPEFAGCLWPMDPACQTDTWYSYPAAVQERSLALASATLQRLTGGRVGNCPITIRPCRPVTACGFSMPFYGGPSVGWAPMNWAGVWSNSCGCTTNCACKFVCAIDLPGPVGRVDEVKLDGAVLDTDDYTVRDGRLIWTGEDDCPWPADQNLSLPDTEEGTFSVTYLNAHPVDSLGAYAVGVLANEYAKACTGSKCRLPKGVTSIARMGVSIEVGSGAFPGGLTGINEVDAYIALWNPGGLQRQATVWSPDVQRVGR